MRYAEIPPRMKEMLRDVQPQPVSFEYRPLPESRASSRSDYVELSRSLPLGLLNAKRPKRSSRYNRKIYSEISGGKGFSALNEEIVYKSFSTDISPDPNWPVSRDPAFYDLGMFQCWAADERAYAILTELGIMTPGYTKPVYELTSKGKKLPLATLVDFPAADVIDYDRSAANWSVIQPLEGQANIWENYIYLPHPVPRAVQTVLRDGNFGAPIVRERHALNVVFAHRAVLEKLQAAGIQGPDYSVLAEIA